MITVSTLTGAIAQLLPEPQAGLLSGLLFGTKEALTPEFKQALITTGTLHIVALSGMNITIMSALIGSFLLPLSGRRWASLLTIGAIAGFVLFVGPAPSIIRAAIMATLSLVAVVLGKQNWALFSWAISVGAMLVVNFSWITDLSFQLSVLSTLGILLFSKVQKGVNTIKDQTLDIILKRSLVDDLRLTLAAQVFTVPLILFVFHRVSLISPLPNILIGWILAPVTVLGWLTIIATFVWWPIAQLLAWVTWAPLTYLIWIVTTTSLLPFASLSF